MINNSLLEEDEIWETFDPELLKYLDKLYLSRLLQYRCGPVGVDVPSPEYYIVRPCVNALGLGLGAERKFIQKSTDHLPYGYFWSEWFNGRHYSVDFEKGIQKLCVEGVRDQNSSSLTKWKMWKKVNNKKFEFPSPFKHLENEIQWTNIEFIGDKIIEIHFRKNFDFQWGNTEFIPVWEYENIIPPVGYKYVDYPDIHGRVGAFIK